MERVELANKSIPVFKEKKSTSFYAGRTLTFALLIMWGIFTIWPLYWMITVALSDPNAAGTLTFSLLPKEVTLDSFKTFFRLGQLSGPFNKDVFRWLFNSFFISAIITLANLFFASMTGYAFAKLKFPGKNTIFWTLMCTMMIPSQVTLIPLYVLVLNVFNMGNTYAAIILPSLCTVGNVFLMKQYMSSIPATLIDAARIDACSEFGIYRKVILPLAKPGLAVLAIFTFVASWNDFFWPLLVTNTASMRTIQVGLASFKFQDSTQYGPMMAGAVIASIPMFILFFSLQKYFLQGITIGAIKG